MGNKYNLPSEDVNDENATIIELHYHDGDNVEKNDLLYTFETTKAVADVESKHEGFILYFVSKGDTISTGELVCEIFDSKQEYDDALKKPKKEEKEYRLTKKAESFAKENNLDLDKLPISGLIKEKDLYPFVIVRITDNRKDRVNIYIDKNNQFIQKTIQNSSFKELSSEEKIDQYRENGYSISKNVHIAKGTVIVANNIEIENNVEIKKDCYIEAPEVHVGKNTVIGENCQFVGSRIFIGDNNKIASEVKIDISGGRWYDSNLITGKGCLFASEVYINICREVNIGDNVALSPRSMIFTHSYWQSILDGYNSNFGPVRIKNNTWIGASSQILPNITVGEGSIVMSASLVTTDVAPFTLVGGVPSGIIKEGLKKNISRIKKIEMIKSLFVELMEWLEMQDLEIKDKNESKFTVISENNKPRKCNLVEQKIDLKADLSESDIYIFYNNEKIEENKNITALDIQNEVVSGKIDREVFLIIEFFRRKGICLYEK